MNFEFSTLQEIAQHAIDKLNGIGVDTYGCDLHNELFNQDYYIIGRYEAEQWLIKNGGVFANIGVIQEYETDNFGEVTTDLSEPERVVNMAVYIAGEEVLSECEHLQERRDEKLTAIDIERIVSELKEAFNL